MSDPLPMTVPMSIAGMPPFGSADAVTWDVLRDGVEVAWIYGKDASGPRAALLRYTPGAVVPEHEHLGYEHIFVLEGAQSDGTREYPAGTFTVFPPGWSHRVTSASGCVVLAVWTGPLRFRED